MASKLQCLLQIKITMALKLQLSKLQITIQTTKISFTDIFGQNEFSCKQALSNSFYLTSLLVFRPYWGK